MGHRTFTLEPLGAEPHTFAIEFAADTEGNAGGSESFTCLPQAPISQIRLVWLMSSSNPLVALDACYGFIFSVLDPESEQRFRDLLDDKTRIVPHDALAEIAAWLVQEFAYRPFLEASGSSDGATPSGDASTPTSSAPVSTSAS